MGWLNDPRVRPLRDEVAADLRRTDYPFRNVGPVIFLCGAANSEPRQRLAQYLGQRRLSPHVFYAEDVWDVIARANPGANALEVEERLASLSDCVLLIVESAGTCAELGAFAISESLRRKLLPVLDVRFENEPSFLRTGPVNWVDRDSLYAPSIWVHRERILECAAEIDERLSRIPADKDRRITDLRESPKHMFFFVCDLVAVFGPCSSADVRNLTRDILQQDLGEPNLYLGLGCATRVLQSFQFEGTELFLRPLSDGRLRPFHRTKKYLNVPTLRARMMSALQRTAAGRELLAIASQVSHGAS